jgi:hypothetical protein
MTENLEKALPKLKYGDKIIVTSLADGKKYPGEIWSWSMNSIRWGKGYGLNSDFNKYNVEILNNDNIQSMPNIQEKFILAFKSEPEKTFRKTGLTNGDDILTEDGIKVFLSWLLKKNQDAFKTEVADNLLADIEKEKK